jgi:hypothetical protein
VIVQAARDPEGDAIRLSSGGHLNHDPSSDQLGFFRRAIKVIQRRIG